jgi:hypothetical protein
VELFDWLRDTHGIKPDSFLMSYVGAAESGTKEILQRIPPSQLTSAHCRYAIRGQQFALLKCLVEEWRVPIDSYCLSAAVAEQRFDIYEYLLERNCEINMIVFRELAAIGRVDLMDSLQKRFSLPYNGDSWMCTYAAMRGQTDTVRVLHFERGCEWTNMTTSLAAGRGHLACLKYLIENGCSVDSDAIENAGRHGYLEIVQYLASLKVPLTAELISSAASQGHLDVIQWALSNGCPINSRACAKAAGGGYIEILEFLKKSGHVHNDPQATEMASMFGRLAALKWLIANGAEVTDKAHDETLENGDKEMEAVIRSYFEKNT